MGPEKSIALLEFDAFTGCDLTSKFNGKSKATCWKAFLDASEDVLTAFGNLGVTDDLADVMVTSLEKYVVRLLCESVNLKSLTDVRWSIYTKQQDCDNLPPMRVTLKLKVSRSHLICLIWKSSHLQFPKYCDPTTLGWEKLGDVLMPNLMDEPPAPEAVIEISLCKCKQFEVSYDASVRGIPWFVQKCVYILDVKTLLLTRSWSTELYIMRW